MSYLIINVVKGTLQKQYLIRKAKNLRNMKNVEKTDKLTTLSR